MVMVVDVPLGTTPVFFGGDRGLEEEAESRGPFRRERPVYWWVTVGVGAPGRVRGVQGPYRGSQECMSTSDNRET